MAMAQEAMGRTRRLYINKADNMGLTDVSGARKRAHGLCKGCRSRLDAEIAKTDEESPLDNDLPEGPGPR